MHLASQELLDQSLNTPKRNRFSEIAETAFQVQLGKLVAFLAGLC